MSSQIRPGRQNSTPSVQKKMKQANASQCSSGPAMPDDTPGPCEANPAPAVMTVNGRGLRGFEVDRACRAVIDRAGLGDYFIHRTGHSLGTEVHGNGVHMDDFETRDERRLIPGTGFTIEPGVYTKDFGVRTEINMFVGEREANVTGPVQTDFVLL